MQTPPYNLAARAGRGRGRARRRSSAAIEDELPGVVGARPGGRRRSSGSGRGRTRSSRASSASRASTRSSGCSPSVRARTSAAGDPGRRGAPARLDGRVRRGGARGERPGPDRGRGTWSSQRLGGDGRRLRALGGRRRGRSPLSGWGGPTPNGIRIGPVYTPPDLRGRGYATVARRRALAALLDGGRRFCFLFTDLANPTSNAIYERIGYVRVCESAMVAFAPA